MATLLAELKSENTDDFYIVKRARAPWGDYGHILVHGMTGHLGRKGGEGGPLQLERTGPFVPPITFPGIGDVIVTDEMKQLMEQAGFRGISFRAVEKAHITNVPWHEWDLTAADPAYYPDEGEPEGYILDRPHSAKLAESLGTIWEVVVVDSAEMVDEEKPNSFDVTYTYVKGSWNGNDLFSVPQNYYKYTSARAKAWLEQHVGRWVSFRCANRH